MTCLQKLCVCLAIATLLCDMVSVIPQFAYGTGPQDLATRLGGNTTGIYYPLYNLDELPQVLAAKKAFPNVPFNVNINPASGPGTGPSPEMTSAIMQLKQAGIVVTGYVPTGYGKGKSIADVEGMISSYSKFYPSMLDGIMFDEVSGSCADYDFYKTVSDYARSIGYSYIRANPGGSMCQNETVFFDQVAVYEGSGYPSESVLASGTFYPQYSKSVVGFGATVHSEPAYDPGWIYMATKYLKWIYITDRDEPNPYSVLPSYFNQYLADLSESQATSHEATPEFASLAPQVFMIAVIVTILVSLRFYNLRKKL